ncbi:MAG: 1-deoxy-D-xylulose-5-phosphate synthase [Synergistaceae bacterium]|nr:1-deoxy-D-xylulose-5-phosphate synthase [Synergistaceae bacterium]
MGFLENGFGYDSLKKLDQDKLSELALEVRKLIIDVSLQNGGHMASSLGCVELSMAILRQFDLREDKVVYDVGHQAYAHKILTDRLSMFHTLRTEGGISGFPKRSESEFDHFNVGHSSTSISAALGYAKARDLLNKNHHVVAVIGDASLINGLAFEALNHVRELNTRVILILNDNTHSINRRVGGISHSIARLSSNPAYNKLKKSIKKICATIPGGNSVEKRLERFRDHIKHIMKPDNIFDDLGINYWGPFDGHDIQTIEGVLQLAKRYDRPSLLHFITTKGKGYTEAENNPVYYHGVPSQSGSEKTKSWSLAASERIEAIAAKDSRIVCLTAAMTSGTKLDDFAKNNPNRFFDVGIAESHMMTMAAGLAAGGLKPWVFIYSTFLQRAVDQLTHDIALQNLPVVIMVDRAGLIGDDGETHQGLLDVSWCRAIPNIKIFAPRDETDLDRMMNYASVNKKEGPIIIRYPRGNVLNAVARVHGELGSKEEKPEDKSIDVTKSEIIHNGTEWAVMGYGATVNTAIEAMEMAAKKDIAIPTVIDLRILKPLDCVTIDKILMSNSMAVVAEDNYTAAGIGEAIAARAIEIAAPCRVKIIGVPSVFVAHATVKRQREICGITAQNIVSSFLNNN